MRRLAHNQAECRGRCCGYGRVAARAPRAARARVGAAAFMGGRVRGGGGGPAELGARVRTREASPLARFEDGDWSGYWASRSANMRSEVGRSQRRLAREHRV